ncbi:MAG TPA: hypothetical protein VM656_09625 [Pyrinomonadaceae bacterium]|nr:hypothetical protein [Pyrinomonadaceae bacterium]
MTAPAKATATLAKKADKNAAKRTQTADFDFSGVTVADGEVPTRTGSRVAMPNPFVDHLKASAEKRTDRPNGAWVGGGKTLTVPEKQVKTAVNLIRYGANRLGFGVTIAETPQPGGKVRIDFAAKNRKAKRTKVSNGV